MVRHLTLCSVLLLVGCSTVKKSAVVATGAATGAVAGAVASGGVAAPIVGASVGAFVTDVVTEIGGGTAAKAVKIAAAPDNLWSVAQKAVEIGGLGLILFFLVPVVLGWLLPGPLKLNRDKKK